MTQNVLSVKQLNLYVRSLIEGDPRLINVSVSGEISNFKNHYSSGHLYFTLKDNDASIRCVMFRGNAVKLRFAPIDGQQVIIRGRASIYEKDGQYQFYAEEMTPLGLGDIALAFEQIKEKLQKEGLFDAESKRRLPKFPENIAVVTSGTGAAVQDILNILSRRWPLARVVLCPVSVQGENAVPEMLEALDSIYEKSFADVIIIGRGGGSIEDLWAFNSEELARKLYESPVPVISAVGHETDFTICDFVADMRAPTPSAAAELAVPDQREILSSITKLKANLKSLLISKYNLCEARLSKSLSSKYFKDPVNALIYQPQLELDRLYDRLYSAVKESLRVKEQAFKEATARLDALSPLKVLSRGFTAVTLDEKNVTSVADIKSGDNINIKFKDGFADCTVNSIKKD